jgi:DNA polymerase-3 subunit alpha
MKKDPSEVAAALPQSKEELKCELYPKNATQVWDTYKETGSQYDFYDDEIVRNAIQVTYDIAHDQIGDINFDTKIKLPALGKIIKKESISSLEKVLGENATEDDYAFEQLKQDVVKGAKWRGVENKNEYVQRLKKELGVVKKLKFAKYFLTYAQIMKLIGEEMLTGTARGSAGASCICYVLGITQMDPVAHNLLFERFLTTNKKGYPDIDSDSSDRDKAVKILTEYFGEENVIPVSNFNQLQLRSLIKDVCRLNGIPFDQVNAYTKKIETEALNEAKKIPGFDRQVWEFTYDEAEKNSQTFRDLMKEYPDMEKTIHVLFKQMRNVSRHAGGVIITDDGINNMPVIKSGGVIQTPWQEGLNYRHLEGFGFLKFDILGLGTLRMFENCIRRILKKRGKKYPTFADVKQFFYEELHPDNNPMTDLKVYEHVYWNKNYTGIFQFVQDNVQNFMAQMKPRSVVDIAVATSIFRPGPLGLGVDKMYLENRKNSDSIVYQHPLLEEVLSPTSGLLVFQEQLQEIYHKLAGVPLDDTDSIRKAFTKKDISNKEKAEKDRLRLRNDFIQRCEETNNVGTEVSGDVFDMMEKLVSYSFNKSHAVAYAITSYQCSHLLTYYPDEWVATYIDYCATSKGKVTGKEDPKAVALAEARGLGYKIGKPDINKSSMEYDVQDGYLIPSFAALKGVGATAYSEIKRFRPYKSVEDLLWNSDDTWRHSKFNKRAMESLIKLEAFDDTDIVGEDKMFKNYKQLHYILIENADKLKRSISKKKKTHKELLEKLTEEAQEIEDWDDREKIDFSKEITGAVNMDMIITPEIREYFKQTNINSIDKWTNDKELYWAIVQRAIVATTRNGKKYCKTTMYGESGQMQSCFFWSYNPGKDKLLPDNTLIIGNFKKSDFGLSSFYGKIQVLEKQK